MSTSVPNRHVEGHLLGAGGARLHHQSWLPAFLPEAHVVIAHGIGSHGGSYGRLTDALLTSGYAVHALDQRGHGGSEGARANLRRFGDAVSDLRSFILQVGGSRAKTFLLGHSWGGLLSLAYAHRWQSEIDGLVLCAAAVKPSAATPAQIAVVRKLSETAPDQGVVKLNLETLTRDPEARAAFEQDPLVHRGKIPARMAAETVAAIAYVHAGITEITLPILVMHGTGDEISDPGGSQLVYDGVSSGDRTLKLYDGLWHQLFNEPERETVLADVTGWLQAHQ